MKIKGIKIDEDVARIFNEQDNDDTSKYRVYYTNESKNEGFISPAEERQIFQCFIRCGQDIDKTIETLRLAATHFEEADIRKVCAYAYVDLASEDWFTKHPYWEEDMPIEAYNNILKGAEEILGEKLRDDYYVESAKKTNEDKRHKIDEDAARILNEQDNDFPEGSFAAWYGEDLSGQTYEGDLYCQRQNLTSLFGCPSIVTGHFNCSRNQLTSLEGAPKEVEGDFDCYDNKLISLQGAPQKVGRDFNCRDNKLTSLQGAPQKVGGDGDFDCSYNELTSLEGAPKEVEGDFDCSYNELTSLEGTPKEVGGYFDCSYNELTSLEGAPEKVGGYFNCYDNKLTSLEGAPKEVRGSFDCSYNPDLKSLDGIGKVKGKIYADIKSKKKRSSQLNLSTLEEIKDYMEENNLEEYDLTYNEVKFTFYLKDDELSFEFVGPIWFSDSSEISEDIIEEGDLSNIAEYIIEEGEEFTPPGQSRFEDGAYYRTDSGEIIQYIAMRDQFYTLDGETIYSANDFKKSDLEYIGELDEDEI